MMRRLIFWSLGILGPLALGLGWWLGAWWELLMLPPIALALWATWVPGCDWWGPVMRVFPTRKREALLTFDLGPDPEETPQVLDLLDAHRARALFFVSGEKARHYPELIQEIVARGHGLGLHGMSDTTPPFLRRTSGHWRVEIRAALQVIGHLLPGYTVQWFRTANGCLGPWLHPALETHQLRFMGWSASDGPNGLQDFEALVIQLRRDIDQGGIIRLRHGRKDAADVPMLPDVLADLLPWLIGQSYRLGEDV